MSTLGNKYNFSSSSGGGGLIGSWSDFILNRSLQDILPTIMLNDRTKGTLIGGLRRRVTDAPNNHIHKSMIDAMALMVNIGINPADPNYQTETRNRLFFNTADATYIPYSTIRHKTGIQIIVDIYLKAGIIFKDKTGRFVWNIGRLLTELNTGCLVVSSLAAYLTDVEIAYFLQGNVAIYLQQSGSAEFQFMTAVVMGCLLAKFNNIDPATGIPAPLDLAQPEPDIINVVYNFTMATAHPNSRRMTITPTDQICNDLSMHIQRLIIANKQKISDELWPFVTFTVTLILRLHGHPFGHAFELSVTYDKGNYYALMYDGYSTKYIKKSSSTAPTTTTAPSSAFSSFLLQCAQPTTDKRVYMYTIESHDLVGLDDLHQMYKGVVIPAVRIPITFGTTGSGVSTDPNILTSLPLVMNNKEFYEGIRGQCVLQGKSGPLELWVPFIKTAITDRSRYNSIYPREILQHSTAEDLQSLGRIVSVMTPRSQQTKLDQDMIIVNQILINPLLRTKFERSTGYSLAGKTNQDLYALFQTRSDYMDSAKEAIAEVETQRIQDERNKEYAIHLEAINIAYEILNTAGAYDLFARAVNEPSLTQVNLIEYLELNIKQGKTDVINLAIDSINLGGLQQASTDASIRIQSNPSAVTILNSKLREHGIAPPQGDIYNERFIFENENNGIGIISYIEEAIEETTHEEAISLVLEDLIDQAAGNPGNWKWSPIDDLIVGSFTPANYSEIISDEFASNKATKELIVHAVDYAIKEVAVPVTEDIHLYSNDIIANNTALAFGAIIANSVSENIATDQNVAELAANNGVEIGKQSVVGLQSTLQAEARKNISGPPIVNNYEVAIGVIRTFGNASAIIMGVDPLHAIEQIAGVTASVVGNASSYITSAYSSLFGEVLSSSYYIGIPRQSREAGKLESSLGSYWSQPTTAKRGTKGGKRRTKHRKINKRTRKHRKNVKCRKSNHRRAKRSRR